MADKDSAEYLESSGLIGHSYDALFSIRKRIRSVSDLQIPLRGGVTNAQIGISLVTLIFQVLTLGLILAPTLHLLRIDAPWWLPVLWLFGPVVFMAQRIVKPMPYGKGIPDTVISWVRYLLDDPVHRRGKPVSRPQQPADISVAHYEREWVMFDDYADVESNPAEAPVSDEATERRFKPAPANFSDWWTGRAVANAQEAQAERNKRAVKEREEIGSRRGAAARAIIPTMEDRN